MVKLKSPKIKNFKKILPGLYKIRWRKSRKLDWRLAAVGMTSDGSPWYAPINWVTADKKRPYVASTNWSNIKYIQLIASEHYDFAKNTKRLKTEV